MHPNISALIAAAADAGVTIDLASLLPVLLSTAGLAFFAGVVKIWRDLRRGVTSGRRALIEDLMAWRDDADNARQVAQADADFWRDVAAQRGGQLREEGITPAVPEPVPPSVREPHVPREAPRRRGRRPLDEQEEEDP